MFLSACGNIANKVKGAAKPIPKPNMVTSDTQRSVLEVVNPTKAAPRMGPVQLKLTNTVVSAMKKGASNPPLSACSSLALTHFSGILISNNPKKLSAKTKKIIKNSRLGIQWVPMK